VTDRDGERVKLTEAKWAVRRTLRSTRATRGCAPISAPRRRADDPHRLVEHEIEGRQDSRALEAIGENGYALSSRPGRESFVRVVETETRPRANIAVPVRAARSPIYATAQAVREALRARRPPPFTVTVGKEREARDLRRAPREALDAAKQGIQLSRFKGLGEMNAEQLWETTMDPAKRLLIRVDVEDAARADRSSRC
jgi:DNA gyrase/topoisomerase IV subunit B